MRSGFIAFWRNNTVSLAAILAMTITIFVIGSLILGNVFMDKFLDTIKEKVDVTVYFRLDAAEADILSVKRSLESLPEVGKVEYISREEAIKNFRQRHKDDAVMLSALEEVGGNPLRASLNIKAKELSQYESVSASLKSESALSANGESIIEKVNYMQNKLVIDRMGKIIDYSRSLGTAVALVLSIMSVLVTFNTISLALYSSREEISVMKLVGAANNFVRGPFVVQGIMYGVISAILAVALMYPAALWIGQLTENAFGGMNLFAYYTANFGKLFMSMIISGALIGIISSYLAIIKYLKV